MSTNFTLVNETNAPMEIGAFHAIKNDPITREPKDLLDIIQLARRNGMDIGGAVFRKLCNAYGTQELFKKIQLLTKESS